MYPAQVLLEHVFVGEALGTLVQWTLEAVWHLVDAVLMQGQTALPGEHLNRTVSEEK